VRICLSKVELEIFGDGGGVGVIAGGAVLYFTNGSGAVGNSSSSSSSSSVVVVGEGQIINIEKNMVDVKNY
jgi:hypothetical protein